MGDRSRLPELEDPTSFPYCRNPLPSLETFLIGSSLSSLTPPDIYSIVSSVVSCPGNTEGCLVPTECRVEGRRPQEFPKRLEWRIFSPVNEEVENGRTEKDPSVF